MPYCTIDDVKNYLGISGDGDNELLGFLISRAQKAIESKTDRIFEDPGADATRYFTVGVDTDGLALYFDQDIYKITTVKSNADNASPTTIASTDYITMPRNRKPYYGIKILTSSNEHWEYTDDPENGIQIIGRWAYSESPPDDIVQACVRFAAYLYRQKDAQVFDVTAIPEAGVITIPQGIPADVKLLIDPYIRPRL